MPGGTLEIDVGDLREKMERLSEGLSKEEAQKAARELGLDDMEVEMGHLNWLRSVGYFPGQVTKKKKK